VLREAGMRDARCGRRGVVADIGTGCGCIALSLAVEGAFERVIAVERSRDAAALARENVALLQPPFPVEVREGDLLGPLAGERYRAIVSNPPYLTEAEYAALDPAVRLFEPRESLVSGADGLTATRALLEGAAALLEPGGCVVLEIDERRADAARRLALRHSCSPRSSASPRTSSVRHRRGASRRRIRWRNTTVPSRASRRIRCISRSWRRRRILRSSWPR